MKNFIGLNDYRFCPFCGEELKQLAFLGETCDCQGALYYQKLIREKRQLEKALQYKQQEIEIVLSQTIRQQKISQLEKELDEVALKYRVPDTLCDLSGEEEKIYEGK